MNTSRINLTLINLRFFRINLNTSRRFNEKYSKNPIIFVSNQNLNVNSCIRFIRELFIINFEYIIIILCDSS